MTLRAQYLQQSARAAMLVELCGAKDLALVIVKYPGEASRVSIIGHTISWGAVDVWRHMGAHVRVLRRLS